MASSIINSDDGVISGTSGLKSTGGDDGVLVFQSKGTETARINTDKQIVAAAGTASLPVLTTTGDVNTGIYFPAADNIGFVEGGVERARINSDGEFLFHKTTGSFATAGVTIRPTGAVDITRSANAGLFINRLTSDGSLVEFYKDGTNVGSVGVIASNNLYIANPADGLGLGIGDDNWYPTNGTGSVNDNAVDLGDAVARFDDIYATNNVIQTSDANEKQDIEALSEAETRVALAAKGLLKKYRWKSAVAEKGDDARIHFGIIAQDLKAAFKAEGLDAGRYAMFIHSTWWEKERVIPAVEADEENGIEAKESYTRIDTYQTEAEAPEGAVRKERMGIRYNELLAFMVAAL